eukprot:TRINITY_DN37051_c0_g1_i1.p1 TRINITY_DN37051_c0_g1~~TRINITY_DN37051_c0_g1_i1.p1  ORF type:complete len:602 (-),score=104.65 TRINITY_DN37051_c0_g1_i1:713-2518(-)
MEDSRPPLRRPGGGSLGGGRKAYSESSTTTGVNLQGDPHRSSRKEKPRDVPGGFHGIGTTAKSERKHRSAASELERKEREHRRHGQHAARQNRDDIGSEGREPRRERDIGHGHGGGERDREREDRHERRDRAGDRGGLGNGATTENCGEIDRDRGIDGKDRHGQVPHRLGGHVKVLSSGRSAGTTNGVVAGVHGVDGGGGGPHQKKKTTSTKPATSGSFSRCRLMDEEWRVCVDSVQPHMVDNNPDFTVVGCVGAQGSGKSTVMSLLIASIRGSLSKHSVVTSASGGDSSLTGSECGVLGASKQGTDGRSPEVSDTNGTVVDGSTSKSSGSAERRLPFAIHSAASFLEGRVSPAGVDLCVSAVDRLLLLDAQPLFNYDVLSDAELKSELHFLLFLTSICHTLVVVMDTPVDLQLLKFLRLLAILKAKVPDLATWVDRRAESGVGRPDFGDMEQPPMKEILPRIIVVFNNVGSHLDDAKLFAPARAFLERSPWSLAPSMCCLKIPPLPMPTTNGADPQAVGGAAAMLSTEAARMEGLRLRECVFCGGPGRGRFGDEGRLQLTEREWLGHISGYWDFLQKAPIVQDYFSQTAKGLESFGLPNK